MHTWAHDAGGDLHHRGGNGGGEEQRLGADRDMIIKNRRLSLNMKKKIVVVVKTLKIITQ